MVASRFLCIFWATAFVTVTAQDAGRPTVPGPTFENAPCPFTADAKVLEQLRCGYVTVPENRAVPDGRRLKLAVAILKSLRATPRPDPVVFLAGGPGNALVVRARGVVTNGQMDALRADRDVILYDQRGVGFSEPVFCLELAGESPGSFENPAARRAHQRQVFARCGDSMRRAGYDLSQYNSVVSAHDLQDLRRALGYREWNLWAVSYGTRVAFAAMRVAPEGIRSAVLDGPSPPNRAFWFNRPGDFADVLKRLSSACAAQPECHAAFPDVEQTFWQTVSALEREPLTLERTLPDGTTRTVTVAGASFVAGVRTAVERLQPAVPLLVHAMRTRNSAAVDAVTRAFARDRETLGVNTGTGLGATVNCFEEAPLNTAELGQRMRSAYPAVLTDGGIFNDPTLCEGLHPFRAGPEHAVLVESDIPALIITGEFDMQTHRSNGEIVARALKHSQSVEFPGAAHVPSWRTECARTIMRGFYNAPLQAVDVTCVKSGAALRFITDVKALVK
jgi:pimeloyl-ACP methyl ester carboxylesterase